MENRFIKWGVAIAMVVVPTWAIATAEEKTPAAENQSDVLIDLMKVPPVAKGDRFAYFERRFGKPLRAVAGNVDAIDFAEHYGPWRTYKVPGNQSPYFPGSITVTAGTWNSSRIHSIEYAIVVRASSGGQQVVDSIRTTLKLKKFQLVDTQGLEHTIGENSRGFQLSNDDWIVSIRRPRENVGAGKVRVLVSIAPPMTKR